MGWNEMKAEIPNIQIILIFLNVAEYENELSVLIYRIPILLVKKSTESQL